MQAFAWPSVESYRAAGMRVPTRRRGAAAAIAAAFSILSACAHLPADPSLRAPLPLPEDRRAAFALDGPRAPLGFLKTVLLEDDVAAVSRVVLYRETLDDPAAVVELHEPVGFATPRPAVLVAPILKGGLVLERYVAGLLVRDGISAAIQIPPDDPLPPERSPEELAADFLESVRAGRAILDFLEAREAVDPTRLGSVGVSLGALRLVVLLAGEARLRANFLALGGLDAGWILAHSDEGSVRRYRRERARIEGVPEDGLSRRFAEAFWFHDAVTAAAIDPRSVVLVLGRNDETVPLSSGLALRLALGNPETRILPLGHYTSAVAAPWLGARLSAFFRARFGIVRRRTRPPRAASLAGRRIAALFRGRAAATRPLRLFSASSAGFARRRNEAWALL